MKTYKIHLIRTGSTATGSRKRYVGQSDIPLCDNGREALQELREAFAYPPVEAVFSSPLSRCVETAGILYPGTQALPLEGLKDMDLGEFEGKTFDDLQGDEAFSAWLQNSFENPPPGGEDAAAFTRRTVIALGEMLRHMMNEGIGSAAAVTHGGVIMTLLAAVGLPRLPLHQWSVANGTGYTLLLSAQMWMRDGAAEVSGIVPGQPARDEREI